MSRPKPLPPHAEYQPSPAEVATLAARFLPPIELPPDWQESHPEMLKRSLGKPTGTPFPHSPEYRPDPGWRLPWEVVCEEAVKRARMLLEAAAGKVRPEVASWDAATAEASAEAKANDAADDELRKGYDKLAGQRKSLPILEVLKFCLPRASSNEVRMRYFKNYLEEDRTAYNERHRTAQQGPIADQAGRIVDRQEFPRFVRGFMAAYEERGEAWRKELAREAGAEGQALALANQRRMEANDGAMPVLNKNDAKKLDAAAKEHTPAKSGA